MNLSVIDNDLTIHLNTRDMVRNAVLFCILIEVILGFLDLFVYYAPGGYTPGFTDLFNLASEASLGTWFSSTQTLAVGVVLWLIRYRLKLSEQDNTRPVTGWTVLAVFFTYMAIDDAVAIHEHLGSIFDDIFLNAESSAFNTLAAWLENYPSYSWQIVAGPLFAAMGVFLLLFLWRQLARPRLRWLIVLALGSLSVAVALDYVEGLYGGYKSIIVATGWRYETVLHVARVIEELLEMLGMTLFLAAFLFHLGSVTGRVHLSCSKI